jgi:preprotein translocase subunit SecE
MTVEVKSVDMKKRGHVVQSSKDLPSEKFKVVAWIESIKSEIRAVHWTSKDELRVYTQIVVIGTFVFGMGVYLVDLMINGALDILTWISRLLVG